MTTCCSKHNPVWPWSGALKIWSHCLKTSARCRPSWVWPHVHTFNGHLFSLDTLRNCRRCRTSRGLRPSQTHLDLPCSSRDAKGERWSLGPEFCCSVHNGLISAHLDMLGGKKRSSWRDCYKSVCVLGWCNFLQLYSKKLSLTAPLRKSWLLIYLSRFFSFQYDAFLDVSVF